MSAVADRPRRRSAHAGTTPLPWYRRALWRVLASALAVVVVAVVVGEQAVRAGTAVLAPGPVALAVGLGALWRVFAATRWLLLARVLGAPLSWPAAFAEYQRSELVNQVVPGGVVGDVDRARRHGQDVGLLPAGRAVLLERAVGQVLLVGACVVVLLLRPELRLVADGVDARTTLVVAVVVLAILALAAVLWRPGTTAIRARWAMVGAFVAALVLSIGILACFVTLFVVAAALTGPVSPLAVVVPAVLVTLLVSGIPLTVAGWGGREAGAALCFAAVGLAAADGVAASVGYGLLSLVSALPGLVPLLLSRRSTPMQQAPAVSTSNAPVR